MREKELDSVSLREQDPSLPNVKGVVTKRDSWANLADHSWQGHLVFRTQSLREQKRTENPHGHMLLQFILGRHHKLSMFVRGRAFCEI